MSILSPAYIRKIWSFLLPGERKTSYFLLFLMLIGIGLETVGIGLIIPALALFTQKNIASDYPALQPFLLFIGNPDQKTLVTLGLLMLFIVYLIKNSFLLFLAWRQNEFIFTIGERLSQRLFEIYLYQPYTFHLQRNSAELIRNTTNEVNIFTGNVLNPILQLITEVSVLTCICALLLSIEPVGTITIVFVVGIASFIYFTLTKKKFTLWGEARQYHDVHRLQHLQESLGGIKDVKILSKETYFLEQYNIHNKGSSEAGKLNATMQQVPRLWLELLSVSGLVSLVLSLLAQDKPLDTIIPRLGLFAVATFRIMPSVNRILNVLQILKFCLPVITILDKDFSQPAVTNEKETNGKISFNNSIELSNISFSYPESSEKAIDNITLSIRRGESIAFIGASGSGKSTLADILLGLLSPDQGGVFVDNINISSNIRNWQKKIGYVPQSIYLTDDNLLRNIAFGLPDAQIDIDAAWHAIRSANLDTFIKSLPEGLETMVGERGVRLSGGQRQRIGIARALYHNPEILLLDEATSALDNETEENVMNAVKLLRGTKTIIIIAHRLSTIEQCDYIYKLDNGKILSSGKPEEILRKNDRENA